MSLVCQQSQRFEIVFESRSSVDSSIWQKEITVTTTGLWVWGILLIIIICFVGAISYMFGTNGVEKPDGELEISEDITADTKDNQEVKLKAELDFVIGDDEENQDKFLKNFWKNRSEKKITEELIKDKIEKRLNWEVKTAVKETILKDISSQKLTSNVETPLKTKLGNLGLVVNDIRIEIVDTSVKVPESEIFIDVDLTGERAVYTQDYQKLEAQVSLYVYIKKENKEAAIAYLPKSEDNKITLEGITEVVEKRVVFAVRSVARKKDFKRLKSDIETDVKELLEKPLENIGLSINDLYVDILSFGEVPESEFAIDVVLTDELSVRTKDFLRADIRATLYVYINDREKAKKHLSKGGSITLQDIEIAVKERANSAIRIIAATQDLKDIHSNRTVFAGQVMTVIDSEEPNQGKTEEKKEANLTKLTEALTKSLEMIKRIDSEEPQHSKTEEKKEVLTKSLEMIKVIDSEEPQHSKTEEKKEALTKSLENLGLKINGIYITEVEESDVYSSDDIFDIEGITKRTKIIQDNLKEQRKKELDIQGENEANDIKAQKTSLTKAAELEQAKIQQELDLEKFRHEKELEQELAIVQQREQKEKEIAEKEKTIELDKLKIKAELEEKKLEREKAILSQYRAIEEYKVEVETAIYTAKEIESGKAKELAQLASIQEITTQEIERLKQEVERVTQEESIATAIEKEKAQRQEQIAKLLESAAQHEASKIIQLAQAEIKGKANLKDADRMADLIMALAPKLMESLPEIAKAASLQPGALADANIYTLSGKNGSQDVKNLMLSSSGLLILNALSEKFLHWLEKGAELMRSKEPEENGNHLSRNVTGKTVDTQSRHLKEDSSLQNENNEKIEENETTSSGSQEKNNDDKSTNFELREEENVNSVEQENPESPAISSNEE